MQRNRTATPLTTSASRRLSAPLGVTLLELLVVLAILLALLAIALPFSMRTLETRQLEATEESIASELIKARVRAQESGRPVEVIVLDTPQRVVTRFFGIESATASRETRSRDGAAAPVRDTWWEESQIDPSISVYPLALGAPPNDNVSDERPNRIAGPTASADAPTGLRLAVYLPDGTTLFATTLMLLHQSGLRSSVSVDPWTGQPAITRRSAEAVSPAPETPADDDASSVSDEDPADELADFEPAPPHSPGDSPRNDW